MKKVGWIVLALLVVAYPLYSWILGRAFESQQDKSLHELMQQVPYLHLKRNEYHRGWYSSEQDLEFSLRGFPVPGTDVPTVTVHNHIQHGPLAGGGCFGQARIDTHLILSKEIRDQLAKVFGSAEPLGIRTCLALMGGGRTHVTSPALHDVVVDKGTHLDTDGMDLLITFAPHRDAYTAHGGVPHVRMTSDDGRFELTGLRIDADNHRLLGGLFGGDTAFTIKHLEVNVPHSEDATGSGTAFAVDGIEYRVNAAAKDGFVDMGFKLGSGAIAADKVQLNGVHFDGAFRHLQMQAIDALSATMRELQSANNGDAAAQQQALTRLSEPLKQEMSDLLTNDPLLVFDRIGAESAHGAALAKGSIKFTGITAADIKAADQSPSALLRKIEAAFDLSIDDAFIQDLPESQAGNIRQSLQSAWQNGTFTHEQGTSRSHITWHEGQLLVNGKAMPVPLPGASGPTMVEPMPSPAVRGHQQRIPAPSPMPGLHQP